ncbi:MAG: RNA polymerase subunit sigma-24 [Halomonas sp.]|nr:RNA polymerase subunit sigma-24 [Halomonas sp.]|tara:strand:- start:1875 stop:3110 length:1236 start_codon:yes stop_codon:yes gene_type:complete
MQAQASIESFYRRYAPRVRATLIRRLGDFDSAEDALQDAFAEAITYWPQTGIPNDPVAWLISVGHRRGIDQIRRNQTARRRSHMLIHEQGSEGDSDFEACIVEDDPLRLLFTCCHPALGMHDRLALTLREMVGLSTEQVASALLQKPTTLAQRIVRAKRRIKKTGIPYEIPGYAELPQRLPSVLAVIYLIFNEGYSRSEGDTIVDVALAQEAISLAQTLARLLPNGEVFGLLALMLLHHARRDARQNPQGELVPLEHQQRALWDGTQIAAGEQWLHKALRMTPTEPYTLQASIAAVHAQANDASATDWARIARLYGALHRRHPSPVIALNRAVAVAMSETPEAGLSLLEAMNGNKYLMTYHLYHAALADLHRRAGHIDKARRSYRHAVALCAQGPERRFLANRLSELDPPS